jgi:hypothetical protein
MPVIDFPSGYDFAAFLREEGYILPDECISVDILVDTDSPLQLVITVNLTDETLAMVGRALLKMSSKEVK